ncbi:MAG: glycosyltransferase [Bacteroidetes bacterium]|nr:glycosyltransferase [Bacteroidota bacterium]
MKRRLISVITINYNNAAGLAKTIESITSQTFTDFEYIIIDGGSTDESVEVIKKFENRVDYWVSENDNGIYNAFNKGIHQATGEFIFFLNSGDMLSCSSIFEEVVPNLKENDIIYGNILIDEKPKAWLKEYPDKLNFRHFIYDSLPHSGGSFFRRTSFKDGSAKYDENLKIVSDWKWFLTAIIKYNYSYKHINKIIGIFDCSGVSSTESALSKKEREYVLLQEFSAIYNEISELFNYKVKYDTLLSSRYLRFCLKLKKLILWQK